MQELVRVSCERVRVGWETVGGRIGVSAGHRLMRGRQRLRNSNRLCLLGISSPNLGPVAIAQTQTLTIILTLTLTFTLRLTLTVTISLNPNINYKSNPKPDF